MRVVVQKFGGTSLVTPALREQALGKVRAALQGGRSPVVVVSAMGRRGAPYATDTLLDLVRSELAQPPARELDMLMACGEVIAGVVFTCTLLRHGIPGVFLNGGEAGILTDGRHGDARIVTVEPARVRHHLEAGRVPVVAGFQGLSREGDVTTLGRGGSDTTAAALGVALGAEAVEIYTDVDGIKTADPRLVEEARTLERVTYNEACQFAQEGARVIHPRAVEVARQGNVPLYVKCTFSEGPGTLVHGEQGKAEVKDRLVTGIAVVSGLAQLKVSAPAAGATPADIFQALARAGVSVDFISVTPEEQVFTVRADIAALAVQVVEALGAAVRLRPGCAKVAVVGGGMTGRPGVMAAIVGALEREGIPILQSADSYTTIWCLVDEQQAADAARALHREFRLAESH